LFGKGGAPYITPNNVGVTMGKLSASELPIAIVPSLSMETTKVAVSAGC